MNKSSLALKAVLAAHTHIPAGPVGGGTPSAEMIVSVATGISADVFNTLSNVTTLINGFTTAINKSSISRGHILSKWNKTN